MARFAKARQYMIVWTKKTAPVYTRAVQNKFRNFY
jgi:hypothetical protein